MSIDSIKERIMEEAQSYADGCVNDANFRVEALLEETRIEAEKIKNDANIKAEKDSKTLVERRESVAGLEARKMQLFAKQEIIQESFDKALEKLQKLDEKEYIAFLTNRLSCFESDGGEIMLSSDDLSKYGEKLRKKFDGVFTVCNEPVDIKGGFLLKQGSISINASVEKLVENEREELTGDIADILF